jgi:hypothetical protein
MTDGRTSEHRRSSPASRGTLTPKHVALHRHLSHTTLRLLTPTEQRQRMLAAGTDSGSVGVGVLLDAVEEVADVTVAVLAEW